MFLKGTFARIVAFTIVTVVLCIVLGFVLSLMPSSEGDMLCSVWNATLCALDGGTIAGIEGDTSQKAVLFVTTIIGVVFTSVLIGIVSTGIEERLESLGCEKEEPYAMLRREAGVLIYLLNPGSILERTVEAMRDEIPSTQTFIAGENVEVSDETRRLVIKANYSIEPEESDNLVIHSLLELYPLCAERNAKGNPLEIICMLYFEKNVEPAKLAGAHEAVLMGRLLADKVSSYVKNE